MNEKLRELHQSACQAREKAYSPYSGKKVGSAVRLSDGSVFQGCNVENSSYGATCCAERVAIQKAVSEKGKIQIVEVMVVTDSDPPWPPCGICRQVISEFAQPGAVIHFANLKGDVRTSPFSEIYPHAFTPSFV